MNVAEAIACLFLEIEPDSETAVEVCGVGYSSDAYHMTHPHPDGKGAQEAMQKALISSSLNAEQIDYINAHGTGTMANDSAEGNAIVSLFSHKPYVSSTKSITGHTLGAAGALEAILSCLAIQQQTILGNNLLNTPDNAELNLPRVCKKSNISYVMSNSFAFGGNNTSLIFGKI
jgi:3-oxoacyl-[acyl-carrier-protein] synthase-1